MSFLDKVSRGRVTGPVKLLVYGAPATGKSTFASGAPSPLFIDVEKRTGHLDVARVQPDTWDDVLGCMRELIAAPGEYKTVVVDTLDHTELLIHKHVCDKFGWGNIEEPSYGKGYIPALLEWSRFLVGCEALKNKGFTIVLLAHSSMRTIKSPTGEDFDRICLKLRGGQKTNSGDLIREKMDLVGYARFEDLARKTSKDPSARAKAITTGRRVLSFKHNPAFENKAGVPIGDELDFTWAAFEKSLGEHS